MAKKIEGSLVESDFDKGYVRFHEDENFGQDLATLVVHGDVFERVFTESEVRAMLNEIRNLADGYWNEAGHGAPDMLSPSEIDGISERGGIFLDPA